MPGKLLAVSYMLPPNLYPQAIQIGRLLASIDWTVAAGGITAIAAVNYYFFRAGHRPVAAVRDGAQQDELSDLQVQGA